MAAVASVGGDDAEVLVVGLHEDVAAAEVDLVGAQVAADDEEAVVERAAVGDLEAGQRRSRTSRACAAVAERSPKEKFCQ